MIEEERERRGGIRWLCVLKVEMVMGCYEYLILEGYFYFRWKFKMLVYIFE